MIVHLPHSEIDKPRWDECIRHSRNRLPYAFSWWLDVVSPGWEALIAGNYDTVMPLTGKRKMGFDYLYQPFFTQQLGVFSNRSLDTDETGNFLNAIPEQYRYIDIRLNWLNNPRNDQFRFLPRINYTLDLTPEYIQLSANYHRNCRRNIQKAIAAGLRVKQGPGPSAFTRFVQRNLEKKLLRPGAHLYEVLQQISEVTIQNNYGEITGVYDHRGELQAAGWFVNDSGRCLFAVCASTPQGKRNQAMYLLVDHVIRGKSGSGATFDFTGSNIPGVAYFNKGFGATSCIYLEIKWNRLPWPARMLKK